MTHPTTPTHPQRPSPGSLWVGLLAGPVIWSLYFIGGYAVSEAACYTDFLGGTLLGLRSLPAVLLLMTAVAFLAILYVGWVAFQNRQRLQGRRSQGASDSLANDYGYFMATVGIMLSGLSAFLTLTIGLAVPFLPVCG
ncbi:MAG: hypothetical protein R3264_01205 [Anaerolineae bacterium]|nr:hypothetical protein [Anaerolineae bacterium]